MTTSIQIARLLIARPPSGTAGQHAFASIGVVASSGRTGWGDCLLPVAGDDPGLQRLVDMAGEALRGMELHSFSEISEHLRHRLPAKGTAAAADAVRGALQQAILHSIATARGQSVASVLADEYGLAYGVDAADVPIYLEVNDFAATAELIDRMLALRPEGIGYRLTGKQVAAAIGENGEHLQRFVRELVSRTGALARRDAYAPAIYLGLNGAFGVLAADPITHIGKVLGNCIGLQDAASDRRIVLEEPFLLEDAIAQAANARRLRDFLRRSHKSQVRHEPALIMQRVGGFVAEAWPVFADAQTVDGLVVEPARFGDIAGTMRQLAVANDAGVRPFISTTAPVIATITHRWVVLAAEMAALSRASAIILNFDDGDPTHYWALKRHYAELAATHPF